MWWLSNSAHKPLFMTHTLFNAHSHKEKVYKNNPNTVWLQTKTGINISTAFGHVDGRP